MRFSVRLTTGLLVSMALATAGCTGATDDDAHASADAVSSSDITLANWQSHEKITDIRDFVAELRSELWHVVPQTRECAPGSDYSTSRALSEIDGKGAHLNVYRSWGDNGWSFIDVYYDATGKLRYAREDVTTFESHVSNQATIREDEAFFDSNGKALWHVFRQEARHLLDNAPYQRGDGLDLGPASISTDPAAFFASSCEEDEEEEAPLCGGFAGAECPAGMRCDYAQGPGLGTGLCVR
jgi:hypothetical protein